MESPVPWGDVVREGTGVWMINWPLAHTLRFLLNTWWGDLI